MGIDAELYIRNVNMAEVDDEWLIIHSWYLQRAIGPKYFLFDIEEGQPCLIKHNDCIEIRICSRFYDIGYERGNIVIMCAIAEWCEVNIEGCSIYYGGDSGGVKLRLFDYRERERLRNHLYSVEGQDYFNRSLNSFRPPACKLCVNNQYNGNQYESGRDGLWGLFKCEACGIEIETHDGGKTYIEREH